MGYKRIFTASRDIKILDGNYKNSEIKGSIVIGGSGDIFSVIGHSPSAIIFPESRINKKALEKMREKEITLCLPMQIITGSYGIYRSRNLYMMSKLFDYASSLKLDVSFATFAKTNQHLCSYMQLIELAKLVGASDDYARKSISEVNSALVIE